MKKSFEERLERLEQLNEQIRQSNISLDDAIQSFEEGIQLAKSLEKDLARVERKVELLVNEPEGEDEKPVLELFPELSELNAGASGSSASGDSGDSSAGETGSGSGGSDSGAGETGDGGAGGSDSKHS
jgi:exodeoxyribonuclease VII small subunit